VIAIFSREKSEGKNWQQNHNIGPRRTFESSGKTISFPPKNIFEKFSTAPAPAQHQKSSFRIKKS
jgi:hypothetical protein